MIENKISLYLDDIRIPTEGNWQVVTNYDEFVEHINKHGLDSYDVISLDHDLGPSAMNEYFNNVQPNYKIDYNNITEKTGYDCAKFLVNKSIETNIPLPKIFVHSANPIGSGNIIGYINNYYKNCRLPQTCTRIQVYHTNRILK
jgi:hypothetical protein